MINLRETITKYNLKIKCILHIGANYCQEQNEYTNIVSKDKIFWIEANPKIVDDIKKSNPDYNIYSALITDKNNEEIDFNISSNNSLSSSIFEFEKHAINHPSIVMIEKIRLNTITLDTFMIENKIPYNPNLLVIDVQGAEYNVLLGGQKTLEHVDIILTEVNIDYTYKDCTLIDKLDNLLELNNFKKVYQYIWKNHTYGDAIYIRSNLIV